MDSAHGSPQAHRSPAALREAIRAGRWLRPTPGLCPGFTQVNLVAVPAAHAYHFLLFCQRNPRPCPLLEVLDEGRVEPRVLAPGKDVRTGCPAAWPPGRPAAAPLPPHRPVRSRTGTALPRARVPGPREGRFGQEANGMGASGRRLRAGPCAAGARPPAVRVVLAGTGAELLADDTIRRAYLGL